MKSGSFKFAFAWSPIESSKILQFESSGAVGGQTLYTVPIASRVRLDLPILPQSFASAPGRYLEALYQKVIAQSPRESRIVFLNPSLLPSEETLTMRLLAIGSAIKGSKRKRDDDLIIWTMRGSVRPIAYDVSLPAFKNTQKAVSALRHLTTLDCRADTAVFSELCELSSSVGSVELNSEDKVTVTPGFLIPGMENILLRQAAHLLKAISLKGHSKAVDDPLYVMPYEAGDLLFFSLALKEQGILNPSILTLDHFSPIVKKVLPAARIVRLPARISESERKGMPELEFVSQHVLSSIPHYRSFIYLRPFRSFWPTKAHLIDQFRFALGFDFKDENDAATLNKFRLTEPKTKPAHTQLRVLCHFEGGWKLKHYPPNWQTQLLGLLKKEGFKVTVLADNKISGAQTVPFKNLVELESLLARTDMMIGVDSFPAHYASLASGIPTMTLFGSTRSSCGHLPEANSAISLERGIDCNPCGQISECHRYFGRICLNYPEPETVLSEFKSFLGLSELPAVDESL